MGTAPGNRLGNLLDAAELAEFWAALSDACKHNRGVSEAEFKAFDKALREWADPNLLYLWTTLHVKGSLLGLADTLRLRFSDEERAFDEALTNPEPTVRDGIDVRRTPR